MTSKYKADSRRWLMLSLFNIITFANALFWVTFAPISNITQTYIGISSIYGSVTAVNMLANISLIFFLPGTIIGNILRKRYGIKQTLLICGAITTVGAIFRFIPTLCREKLNSGTVYFFLLFGQSLAAIAQPFFCNIPAGVASVWFPSKDRDIATTIGSLFMPIGNACGQIFSVSLVRQSENSDASSTTDSTNSSSVTGMATLLGFEACICITAWLLVYYLFESAPAVPPSSAANHLLQLHADDVSAGGGGLEHSLQLFKSELSTLFSNRDYVILWFVFTLCNAGLCGFQILIFQIVEPFGYSNEDAGMFGSVLIGTGLAGAGLAGYLMKHYKAYRVIFKVTVLMVFLSVCLVNVMIKPNNYALLLIAITIMGFFLTPVIPISMEISAETTYPIAEDVSFGMLYVGANVLGFAFVFLMQALIAMPPLGPPPLTPVSIFTIALFLLMFLLSLLYKGEYKRMHLSGSSRSGPFDPALFERLSLFREELEQDELKCSQGTNEDPSVLSGSDFSSGWRNHHLAADADNVTNNPIKGSN